jgi:hypothetical protein
MRKRLFSIHDNEPVITAELVNLSHFKKLWDEDKTKDKSNYKKWLLYIYYMCDYESSFFELNNKEEEVLNEIFPGKTNVVINNTVKNCMKVYVERNTVAEQRSLEGAIKSVESINDNLQRLQQDSGQLEVLLKAIENKVNESLDQDKVDDSIKWMNKKLELEEKHLDITKKIADLIPKIDGNIQSITNLREKVEEAILKKLEKSNDKIENFMIDSLIADKERRIYTN